MLKARRPVKTPPSSVPPLRSTSSPLDREQSATTHTRPNTLSILKVSPCPAGTLPDGSATSTGASFAPRPSQKGDELMLMNVQTVHLPRRAGRQDPHRFDSTPSRHRTDQRRRWLPIQHPRQRRRNRPCFRTSSEPGFRGVDDLGGWKDAVRVLADCYGPRWRVRSCLRSSYRTYLFPGANEC